MTRDVSTSNGPGALDWGVGRYETTAAQLLPASKIVVERAGLRSGERVLDLGCGTGNAALLAAQQGARVTAVDPASRLLEVARDRAAAERADIEFRSGEAASIPAETGEMDVVLSVFALIFAADPAAAAAEVARVLSPTGRLVLSAWLPVGPIFQMNAVAAETVREAVGAPPMPRGFAWHDGEALRELLEPHGFSVELDKHSLEFRAPSVQQYVETETRNHPAAVAGMAVLEQFGQAEALRTRLLEILQDGNEDSDAFRVTSHYIVATATR